VREVITTVLDALGLLGVAAGATAGAWTLLGPSALAVGGLVVLGGSQVAGWVADRRPTQ
jgi:hypothetical protein